MTMTAPAPVEVDRKPPGRFSASFDADGHVTLTGELGITRLDALRAVLDRALLGSGELLPVDVGRLWFIDPAAVSELLRYQLLASTRQRRLCLDPISAPVAMVVDLFDLRHILGTDDEPGAIAFDDVKASEG
jgi:ABC-type transporter Mla MlaB component